MARMISETVAILKEQLTRLEDEARQVRAAIAALNSVPAPGASMSTPSAPANGTGRKKRVANYVYEQTCTRCRKSYMAARLARQGTDQFCHNPCTSSIYRDEALNKVRELQRAEKMADDLQQGKEKPRPTTLLSGDALRAQTEKGRH